jgi:asparagine synthase (glutamine-hydrolysing)
MCGIAFSCGSDYSSNIVGSILQDQRSRGPDFSSKESFLSGKMCIGHNRLNIVDQNPNSNQPFKSRCGKFLISFNGEIYNYKELAATYLSENKLITTSDTEVLVELWSRFGQESIKYLVGMFSFIVYSIQEGCVHIVRDRFGVKPLYYSVSELSGVTVSSELRALGKSLPDKISIDHEVLKMYIEYGIYDSINDRTLVKNIKPVPPASIMRIDLSSLKISLKKYWNYADYHSEDMSQNEIKNCNLEIKGLILDSISIRTKASVPFAINLSGGVDSGALLSGIIQSSDISMPECSYHAVFSGRDSCREQESYHKLIKSATCPSRLVNIDLSNLESRVDELTKICDGPIGGFATLGYYQLHQAIHSDGFRMTLDGQGSDEVFIGYDKYLLKNKAGLHVDGSKNTYFNVFDLESSFRKLRKKYVNEDSIYNDLFHEKLPRNLRMNDRLSMAASIELRSPFLDHRLFEKAFQIPRGEYLKNKDSLKYHVKDIYRSGFGNKAPMKIGKVTNQTESLLAENFQLVIKSVDTIYSQFPEEVNPQLIIKKLDYFRLNGIDNSFQMWRMIVAASILNNFI